MRTRKSEDEVKAVVVGVVSRSARGDLIRAVMNAVADVVLTRVHTAFVDKSQGGTDEFGRSWPDLAESTKRAKGSMVEVQRRRAADWERRRRKLERQLVAAGMSRSGASDKAARLAWGEQTVDSPINVRTGALEASLSPEGSQDQIREVGPITVLGTKLPYAGYVHAKRPILPDSRGLGRLVAAGAAVAARNVVSDHVERGVR